jgi:hypothetical protein
MNERILELYEQSLLHKTGHDYNGNPLYEIRQNPKLFAELIVRECANLLMKPEYVMNHPEELTDYNRGWVNGRLLGIEHIKEHFGVKNDRTNLSISTQSPDPAEQAGSI